MSWIREEHVVSEFVRRTRANLQVIEQLVATKPEVPIPTQAYEVTQLCNSLLGLVVLPQQHWFDKLPETLLAEMPGDLWQDIDTAIKKWDVKKKHLLMPRTFKQFAICLRNSIAHFHVTLLRDDRNPDDIGGIRLRDYPMGSTREEPPIFEIELTLVELKALTLKFMQVLEDVPATES